jgi:hypothetical protein
LERDWWKEKGKEDLQAGDSKVGGSKVMHLEPGCGHAGKSMLG